MSIQYTVLGFDPTTFRTWVSSHNNYSRAPAHDDQNVCIESSHILALDKI